MTDARSVMILEAFGELVDILRRPASDFHAEMQAHLGQHFLDLVERLAAEVRRAQHFRFGLLHQIADVDDVRKCWPRWACISAWKSLAGRDAGPSGPTLP